eukprot:5758648-Karenia_brevis.AAC.1
MWHELRENIGQISFFDSKGQKAPYAKLQCRNIYQANKLMKMFKTKFSRNKKFVGMVTDERGTARRVELYMEKVGTSEKEEKERIMRCLTKTIYDS